MRILISGSSGFVGSNLISFLKSKGIKLNFLKRNQDQIKDITILWHPEKRIIDPKFLEGYDAVIHLSGENLSSKRWNKRQKEKIFNSRIQDTNFLTQSILNLNSPPKIFLCASAAGYYGNCGDKIINEDQPPGKGFLAEVCKYWEQEAAKVNKRNIRVVNLRFGMILGPGSGALAKMLPFFKLGLGGKFGNGKQYISWISIDDTVRAIHHILNNNSLNGPINIVAPNPVTNEEFTMTLGKVLNKTVNFSLPSSMLRILLGEMADELLLSSTRVMPQKLINSGFSFKHETISKALQDIFKV
jgi:uncharacterized protein (TIGR01777 family)